MNFQHFDFLDAGECYAGDAGIELVPIPASPCAGDAHWCHWTYWNMMPNETLKPASYCELAFTGVGKQMVFIKGKCSVQRVICYALTMCCFVWFWRSAQVSCSTMLTDGVPWSAKACQPTKSHVHSRRDGKIDCANNSIPFLCLSLFLTHGHFVHVHTCLLS